MTHHGRHHVCRASACFCSGVFCDFVLFEWYTHVCVGYTCAFVCGLCVWLQWLTWRVLLGLLFAISENLHERVCVCTPWWAGIVLSILQIANARNKGLQRLPREWASATRTFYGNYQECREAADDNRGCYLFNLFLVGCKVRNYVLSDGRMISIQAQRAPLLFNVKSILARVTSPGLWDCNSVAACAKAGANFLQCPHHCIQRVCVKEWTCMLICVYSYTLLR